MEVLDGVVTKPDSLKACGELARQNDLLYFGLRGNLCYTSSNVTNFIQGGPSETCFEGCGDCIEAYQISEEGRFADSIRDIELCGPWYCLQAEEDGGLLCSSSGSGRSAGHMMHALLFVLLGVAALQVT